MPIHIDFEQYELDNGLRVILHQDKNVPIVAVNIWYHVGSKHEQKGKTGFAHLFEHMMFQGSQHVPDNMHFQLIQSIGGTLNGSTFFDRTNYYETLPSHYLEMGLWLEADRMGYLLPAMTQQKLDNQRDVVKNERLQRYDNMPYGTWLEEILALAYPDNFPYHWPVIGYMEDLEQATMDDIHAFFKTYYAPNNASLVVAGDFEINNAKKLIEKHFGPIPGNGRLRQPALQFTDFNSGEKRKTVYDRVQLPRIYMAYHLPPYGENAFYAADMISDIFSEGKCARLHQSLVYEKQIAQEAQAFVLPMQACSLMFFVVTLKPDIVIERVEKELQKEIDRMVSETVSEGEFQRIRNQIEARKVRELQLIALKADLLNTFNTYFDNPDLINHEISSYLAMTRSDIKNTAEKYLRNENRVVVHFLPESFQQK